MGNIIGKLTFRVRLLSYVLWLKNTELLSNFMAFILHTGQAVGRFFSCAPPPLNVQCQRPIIHFLYQLVIVRVTY